MQTIVLILGARGRFGLAAARAFRDAGWRVLGQLRPGAEVPPEPGIEWLAIDLQDTQALAAAARGAAVLVHAINPPYPRWEHESLPALEQAIALANSLKALLMLPGNVYNFGAGMPAMLREDTPQQAQTRKGRIRIAMEQRMRQASEDGQLRGLVVRAGDFFGSGKGSWFDLAVTKNLHKGTLSYPGVWDVPTAWAYLPDLAQAFERLARCALVEPGRFKSFETFHFKGYSLSGSDWIAALEPWAREQGWLASQATLQRGAMPWWLFKSLGWAVPMFRELAEMQYLWHTPHALANDKLEALIGPEPHTPLAQAGQSAVADLGLLGNLKAEGQHATA
jgi:nucleoside-diphosphate-sugar epimerase